MGVVALGIFLLMHSGRILFQYLLNYALKFLSLHISDFVCVYFIILVAMQVTCSQVHAPGKTKIYQCYSLWLIFLGLIMQLWRTLLTWPSTNRILKLLLSSQRWWLNLAVVLSKKSISFWAEAVNYKMFFLVTFLVLNMSSRHISGFEYGFCGGSDFFCSCFVWWKSNINLSKSRY